MKIQVPDVTAPAADCSGLLGRTSLRRHVEHFFRRGPQLFRPSRPDFIETIFRSIYPCQVVHTLFRPSRPDFIETPGTCSRPRIPHTLFRPSRPDFIETSLFPFDVSHFTALFRPSRPDFIETK